MDDKSALRFAAMPQFIEIMPQDDGSVSIRTNDLKINLARGVKMIAFGEEIKLPLMLPTDGTNEHQPAFIVVKRDGGDDSAMLPPAADGIPSIA